MSIVSATRVDLFVGESYFDDARNITLSAIDSKGNKAIFCVNNQKAIILEDEQKTVNEVSLDVKSISRDKVRVDIDVYCEDCECDDNCLNKECIIENTEKTDIEEEIILNQEEKTFLQTEGVEVIENPGLSSGNITLALIILVLFTFGLYYLVKK
jgi:hypothetical protein